MSSDLTEPVSYPQNYNDTEPINTGAPLDIYHAPFSLLHIESQSTNEDKVRINFNREATYYMPRTQEILGEEISEKLNANMKKLPINQQITIANGYQKVHENNNLYGEFLPQTYSQTPEEMNHTPIEQGSSLDPIKYITNFLVQRKLEFPNKKQEIVLHPDIIHFASKGQEENIPKVLTYLNSLAETLDQKLFFENLTFTNEKFKEALGVFEDPMKIYDYVKSFPRLGLVIDMNHLEKSHMDINLIGNIPPERLIIHARQGYNEKYPGAYKYCISRAIPWVIE